jgi:hypothetical protein
VIGENTLASHPSDGFLNYYFFIFYSNKGAPITLNGYLLAIAADTYLCESDFPTVCMPIYPYYEWIVSKLKSANAGNAW